ncbi:4-(cytidine 5'-diphospho)-2-C-methyl-D-erythritol kinase [Pseudodesulfovibrio sp. JC047]|uniref:4-(cytidine 5'-diphospho)-2-C-methyl-D-erythritol kinase n=1 Tax=Pseudodesulfovibrio sp. JC047 TaxID=2683199 RepID=UPI0013D7CD78|nr:4-(cytidine 5'-diphospho)-2-C-methyl-D-erythritol kinase [Pseudodesulfovibrio sp. JC047]
MNSATLIAPAKINLHLEIRGRRPDGYHELRTLFFPVDMPCDLIKIEPGHDEHFYIRCPEKPALETTDNILYTTWKKFGQTTGFQPGIFVTLTKNIPMGGGLGGGSSDAATMLKWLNSEAGDAALSPEKLLELAASLGADVPFFFMDGPAWAEGIGEKLEPASVNLSEMTLLIASPDIEVSTPWAFAAWDEKNPDAKQRESLTTSKSGTKTPSPVSAKEMTNDFEPIVFDKYPRLREIKEKIITLGAETAAMSGSGASIFGLFQKRTTAALAATALENEGIEIFMMECH